MTQLATEDLPVLVALFVRKQSHHGSGVAGLHWSHDEIVLLKLVIDLSASSKLETLRVGGICR